MLHSSVSSIGNKIAARPFLKNVLSLISGTTIAQVITVGTTPIVSRIYTPLDYGAFALYTAIAATLSVAIAGRYEMAIMLPPHKRDAFGLLKLSLIITIGISLFLAAGVLPLFCLVINPVFFQIPIPKWVYLLPAGIFLGGVYQGLYNWSNRNKRYTSMAWVQIVSVLVGAAATLLLGFLNFRSSGLILASIISQVVAATLLFFTNRRFDRATYSFFEKHNILALAKKYSDFPRFSLPNSLLDTFSLQIPVFCITKFFTAALLGHYSFATRLLNKPMSIIGGAVGQVFYQQFSEVIGNPASARALLSKTWLLLGAIAFLPLFAVFLFGEQLFLFAFGDQWAEAGKIASILAPLIFVMFISSPTSTTFVTLRIQKKALVFGIASLIYRPLALYLGYRMHNFTAGLYLFVAFEIVQIVCYHAVAWRTIGKRIEGETN